MYLLKKLIDIFHARIMNYDSMMNNHCHMQWNFFTDEIDPRSILDGGTFQTNWQVLYSQSLHLHTEKLWRSLMHLPPYLDPGAVMRKPLGMFMLGLFLFSSVVKSTGKNNFSNIMYTWDLEFLNVHFIWRHNMKNLDRFYPFI